MASDLELKYVISYFKGAAQSTVSGAHSALLKHQVKMEGNNKNDIE